MDSNASAVRVGPLDPVQNISKSHVPGEKRRDWLNALRDPEWGAKGSGCGWMTLMRRVPGGTLLAPMFCHRWACAVCGPQRAAWLKRQVNDAVERGDVSYFWTLTLRTSDVSAAESYEYISAAWNRLNAALRWKFGAFEFVWTREATKRGYAHLHLLTSLDIEQGELSRLWLQATGGSWVVDVQAIASEKAGNYLSKYVVEQATERPRDAEGIVSRRRVFSKSRGIQFEPFVQKASDGEGLGIMAVPWREVLAHVRLEREIVAEKVRGAPWVIVRGDMLGSADVGVR